MAELKLSRAYEFTGDTEVVSQADAEAYAQSLVAAERERCANLAESYAKRHGDIRAAALEMLAENIRSS